MNLTADLLRSAVKCKASLAAIYAPLLSEATERFSISTPLRLAHFIAQIGQESGSFFYTTELWGPTDEQLRYEGRVDLGNVFSGDGPKFRGHGLIQTTGRKNHARARDGLRQAGYANVPDFEEDPLALAQPEWAARSACLYWADNHCNVLADADDVIRLSRLINRGNANSPHPANGEAERMSRLERAKDALLNVEQPADASTTPVPGPAQTPAPTQGFTEPTPAPIEAPEPNKRKTAMPGILGSIVSAISVANPLVGLIAGMFEPLVQDKINKELERHTDNPAVKEAIEATMMQAAQTATGQTEPLQAVAALQAQPELVKQVQTETLDKLDELAPLFDAMHKRELEMRAADIVSMDAAAARVKGDAFDMTPWLVGGALVSLAAIFGIVGFIVVYQVMATQDHTADTATWAALTGLIGFITGSMLASLYNYRFGTTRNSSANQAAMAELAKRGTPQQ